MFIHRSEPTSIFERLHKHFVAIIPSLLNFSIILSALIPAKNKTKEAFLTKHKKAVIIIQMQKHKTAIGHFQKYHNTPRLSTKILHKHCSHFLLGLTMVPREKKNNAYCIYSNRHRCAYLIFQSTSGALNRGRRLFEGGAYLNNLYQTNLLFL